MTIVLKYWIETPSQKIFERWFQDPALVMRRLAVYDVKKFMNSIAKVECITCASYASLGNIVVILEDKVISQLRDWDKTLQASIHIAIESVIF